MQINFAVDLPELRLVSNPREVVDAIAAEAVERIRRRALAGIGINGPLPSPKDGGRPLQRTGNLLNSLGYVIRQDRTGRPSAVIRPIGDRPAEEGGAAKARSARRRTRELRAAAVLGAAVQSLGGARAAGRVRLSRIRVRGVQTEAALAAVLAQRPHDKRGISGRRAIYDWIGLTELEHQALVRVGKAASHFGLAGNVGRVINL